MSAKLFSDKDDGVLKELYSTLTNKELVNLFNGQYSSDQIKNRAKALGLHKDKVTVEKARFDKVGAWSDWEEEVIRRHFPCGGPEKCAEFLERSIPSIKHKAYRMGVHIKNPSHANGPKQHTDATKKKMSDARRGEHFTAAHLESLRKAALRGDKHPHWKGGRSFIPYGPEFNKELKSKIKGRDKFTCQLCHKKPSWTRLIVHHIDYNKTNSSEENLITLCLRCHNYHHWKASETEQFEQQQLFKTIAGGKILDLMNGNVHLATA